MGLDMRDFEQYVNNFKEMEVEFKEFLRNWITKEGYIVLASIIGKTPRRTGELRRSWVLKDVFVTNNKAGFTVYNGKEEYASIIEYGTPARPNWKWAQGAHMMELGIFETIDKIPDSFNEAFTKFLKEKGLL